MSLKILILGANGFIGSHLVETILTNTAWQIAGLDLAEDRIQPFLANPRLQFKQGDIKQDTAWMEQQIKACDIVLPLVAIANPAFYVQDPLRVFELDFEANLVIVRLCVQYHKRVIFPSTSEVYGMCTDKEFDEETSNLVLGPINKPRWIYSCSKQLIDRIIYAYGLRDGLTYTLFRPFNWFGPNLDNIAHAHSGGSRMATQFIGNILRGEAIKLVNGGRQRRSFTYISDGIAALLKIIENPHNNADKRIFNIGNPHNDVSIHEFAETLLQVVKEDAQYAHLATQVKLQEIAAEGYYGQGYQDVGHRVPAIKNAKRYLDWEPVVDLKTGLRKMFDYYKQESL